MMRVVQLANRVPRRNHCSLCLQLSLDGREQHARGTPAGMIGRGIQLTKFHSRIDSYYLWQDTFALTQAHALSIPQTYPHTHEHTPAPTCTFALALEETGTHSHTHIHVTHPHLRKRTYKMADKLMLCLG